MIQRVVNQQMPDLNRFKTYLQELELSLNTISSYCVSVEQYFQKYGEITIENGLAWKRELQESGLAPKSVNSRIIGLNRYCGMIGNGIKIKTLKIHHESAINNVITEAEYKQLMDGLLRDEETKWYYNILLLAKTGARVSEFIRMKKSDFDRGYAEMWTKGKIRRIYIPKSFRDEAADYYAGLEPDATLVRGRYGQITTRGVAGRLITFADRYGIDKSHMHPHAFRHFFALQFLERNGNISLLSDVLGHSNISTTAIYTRMTKEQQSNAVDEVVNW